jgi:tetratricopeptide (TPR) repeat protein
MIALLRHDYPVGKHFYERLSELASLTDNTLHQQWGYSGRAEATLRAGTLDDAERLALQALRLNEGQGHRTEDIRLNAFLALASWRQGRCDEALQHAATAASAIRHCPYATVATLEGFSAVAEVYLRQYEAESASPRWRAAARQACRNLRRYARVFPVWRPRASCWQATLAWLEGRPREARRLWEKSIMAARTFSLPLNEAMALHESGRLDRAAPQSQGRLERAVELFERIGARHDAKLSASCLTQGPA